MRRDTRIDALRGLAIVLVVAGHAAINASVAAPGADTLVLGGNPVARTVALSWFVNGIYTFHMPLFAFVSGVVTFGREGTPARLLSRRAVNLLVPYASWLVIYSLLFAGGTANALKNVALGLVSSSASNELWFLYALFECFLVFTVVRVVHRSQTLLIGSALLAMAALQVTKVNGMELLFVPDFLRIYPAFVAGYLTARHAEWLVARRWALIPICLTAFFAVAVITFPYFFSERSTVSRLIRHLPSGLPRRALVMFRRSAPTITGVTASIGLYLMATFLGDKVCAPLAWFGRMSLGIYAAHGIALALLTRAGVTQPLLLGFVTLGAAAGATALLTPIPGLNLLLLGKWPRKARSPIAGDSEAARAR